MISEEGVKVETDTSRQMSDSSFSSVWNNEDDAGVTEAVQTPAAGDKSGDDAAAVAETPAPVETETSAPASDAVEAQPITREDGAVWSEKAKRWYLDGKIVAGEAPESPAAAPSQPSIPSVAEQPTPPTKPAEPDPYWVRASGQKTTIPHTFRNPDGSLIVKPEGEAIIRELFTQGIAHRQSWPAEKQRYEERIRLAEQTAEARSGKYNGAAVVYHDAVIGTTERGPTLLAAILESLPQEAHANVIRTWEREAGYLMKDVGHVLKSADLSIPKAPEPVAPDPAQILATVQSATSEEVEVLLDQLGRDLKPDERKEISDAMLTHFKTFWDEREELGGELGLDRHALKAAIEREVKVFQRIRQAALQAERDAQERAKAAAFNARQNTTAPVAKPKKVTATATVSAGYKPPTFEQAWNAEDDD